MSFFWLHSYKISNDEDDILGLIWTQSVIFTKMQLGFCFYQFYQTFFDGPAQLKQNLIIFFGNNLYDHTVW